MERRSLYNFTQITSISVTLYFDIRYKLYRGKEELVTLSMLTYAAHATSLVNAARNKLKISIRNDCSFLESQAAVKLYLVLHFPIHDTSNYRDMQLYQCHLNAISAQKHFRSILFLQQPSFSYHRRLSFKHSLKIYCPTLLLR